MGRCGKVKLEHGCTRSGMVVLVVGWLYWWWDGCIGSGMVVLVVGWLYWGGMVVLVVGWLYW